MENQKDKANQLLEIDSISVESLKEINGFREVQLKLVEENPFVEITDNATYEQGKKHRTALVSGRTNLQNQDKLIASKLTAFRKKCGEVINELVNISLEAEEKQQAEVKRYEAIKLAEKEEKAQKEEQRKEKIKKSITEFENNCIEVINNISFESKEQDKERVLGFLEIEMEVQEFSSLLLLKKGNIKTLLENKLAEVEKAEADRLEKERIEKENEDLRKKEEKRKERNALLQPYMQFIRNYIELLEASDEDFEKQFSEIKQGALEHFEHEAKVKASEFKIKSNRLEEIGYVLINGIFRHKTLMLDYKLTQETVHDCNSVEFEDMIKSCKFCIDEAEVIEAKNRKTVLYNTRKEALVPYWEYLKEDQVSTDWSEIPEDQFQTILKEVTTAKNKAEEKKKLEYKQRQERLADDKEILETALELSLDELLAQGETEEVNNFVLNVVNPKIQALKKELLQELKEL